MSCKRIMNISQKEKFLHKCALLNIDVIGEGH